MKQSALHSECQIFEKTSDSKENKLSDEDLNMFRFITALNLECEITALGLVSLHNSSVASRHGNTTDFGIEDAYSFVLRGFLPKRKYNIKPHN